MKIHLYSANEPLKEHSDVRAACTELVRDAVSGFLWDFQLMGVQPEYPTHNVCRKCLKKATEQENNARQYLYGILPSTEREMSA